MENNTPNAIEKLKEASTELFDAFSSQINELNHRLESLTADQNSQQDANTAADQELITLLNSKVSEIQSNLNKTFGSLNNKLNNLTDEVSRVNSTIAKVVTSQAEVNTRVIENIDRIDKTAETFSRKLTVLHQKTEQDKAELERSLANIQNSFLQLVNSFQEVKAIINNIDKEINANRSQIAINKNQIDNIKEIFSLLDNEISRNNLKINELNTQLDITLNQASSLSQKLEQVNEKVIQLEEKKDYIVSPSVVLKGGVVSVFNLAENCQEYSLRRKTISGGPLVFKNEAVIEDCTIINSCIFIKSTKATIRGNKFINSSIWMLNSNGSIVEHNTFDGDWDSGYWAAGIYLTACKNITITKNKLYNVTRHLLIETRGFGNIENIDIIENDFGPARPRKEDRNKPENICIHGYDIDKGNEFKNIRINENLFYGPSQQGQWMPPHVSPTNGRTTDVRRVNTLVTVWEVFGIDGFEFDNNDMYGPYEKPCGLVFKLEARGYAKNVKVGQSTRNPQGIIYDNTSQKYIPNLQISLIGEQERFSEIGEISKIYPIRKRFNSLNETLEIAGQQIFDGVNALAAYRIGGSFQGSGMFVNANRNMLQGDYTKAIIANPNEPAIRMHGSNMFLSDATIWGYANPTVNEREKTSTGILISRPQDSKGIGSGKFSAERIFLEELKTGIQFGENTFDHNADHSSFRDIYFRKVHVGVRLVNNQAMGLTFDHIHMTATDIGWLVEAGGDLWINNVSFITEGTILKIDAIPKAVSRNNGFYSLRNVKLDSHASGTTVFHHAQPSICHIVLDGVHASQPDGGNNVTWCNLSSGSSVIIKNSFGLQKSCIKWDTLDTRFATSLTIENSRFSNIMAEEILDKETSKGNIFVNIRNCFDDTGRPISDLKGKIDGNN